MSDDWRTGRFSAAWIAQPWNKFSDGPPAADAWVLVSNGATVDYRQYSPESSPPCWKPFDPTTGRSLPLTAFTYWVNVVLPAASP